MKNKVYLRENPYIYVDCVKKTENDIVLDVDTGEYASENMDYSITIGNQTLAYSLADKKIIIPAENLKAGILMIKVYLRGRNQILKYWHLELLVREQYQIEEYVKVLDEELQQALRRIEILEKWKSKKEEIIL